MMKDVGMGMPHGTNITWIQTYLYDFGSGEIKLPSEWTRISYWGHDEEGIEIVRSGGALLWEMYQPTDFARPWDLRGPRSVTKILIRDQESCERFLEDRRFLQYLNERKTDLIVFDSLLQECLGSAVSLLDAPTIQYSNWPIADGYITSLNIPANPSAIPKTATPYSGLGMTFYQRIINLLFHWNIIIARYMQQSWNDDSFTRKNLPKVDLFAAEAKRIIYAGRSEFLFDVVRPINNRVKHFASNILLKPGDFVTVIPDISEQPNISMCDEAKRSHNAIRFNHSSLQSEQQVYCCHRRTRHRSNTIRRPELYNGLNRTSVNQRFKEIATNYPILQWHSLVNEKFILVSFGSLAQAQYMSNEIARKLIYAFSQSPFKVIWATNSYPEQLTWTKNMTIPKNIVLIRWAPLKEMLAHPNLQYLISHGGINTVNELLLFGVPMIGVYLQGDQGSNVRRLADLGVCKTISMLRIWQDELPIVMREFEQDLESYWNRARQLSSMTETYHKLHASEQNFWIGWSIRHGHELYNRTLFRMEYIGDTENLFWFSIAVILSTLFSLLLM
ncbi:unnamed protein product [Cylicocyclus nassatus]|uniref:glucuronosyltransferase n=1 Tax=Cylicocyclus nassatus TaxID=53992 RepID=A0AA36GPT6_CYLNA|nr:unnamed protein product [Cylicocyclus nassatus]